MSPRPRRDLTPFVLVLVVSAVVLFLLVGGLASVGSSSGPFHATIDQSFGAQARVLIAESNSVGAAVRTDVAGMPSFDRVKLAQALDSVVADSESIASQSAELSSPSPEGPAAQNFILAMTHRARALSQLRSTLDGWLAISPIAGSSSFPPHAVSPAQADSSMAAVGRLLVQSDRSYALTRREFRTVPGGSTLPKSVWVTNPVVWDAGAVDTTINQLSSSPGLTPVLDVQLVASELNPPVLPPVPGVAGPTGAPPLPARVSQLPPTSN